MTFKTFKSFKSFKQLNSSDDLNVLNFLNGLNKGRFMALKTFGLMGVDWEERVNLERLRQDRLTSHQSGAQKV